MRSRCRPSIVHVHARVCTYRALMRGRGPTDGNTQLSLTVTSERTAAMTANHPHRDTTTRHTLTHQPERR